MLVFVACLFLTGTRLEFSTSRSDLISAEDQHRRNYLQFQRDFRVRDSLVAVVESTDQERNRAFVERLAGRLQLEPELFVNVYYKGDLRLMGNKALMFLPENTLEELRQALPVTIGR